MRASKILSLHFFWCSEWDLALRERGGFSDCCQQHQVLLKLFLCLTIPSSKFPCLLRGLLFPKVCTIRWEEEAGLPTREWDSDTEEEGPDAAGGNHSQRHGPLPSRGPTSQTHATRLVRTSLLYTVPYPGQGRIWRGAINALKSTEKWRYRCKYGFCWLYRSLQLKWIWN